MFDSFGSCGGGGKIAPAGGLDREAPSRPYKTPRTVEEVEAGTVATPRIGIVES